MKSDRTTATRRQAPTQVTKSTPDLQEQIRRRAYRTVRATRERRWAGTRRLAASRVGGDLEEGDDSCRIEAAPTRDSAIVGHARKVVGLGDEAAGQQA
jgi:hypothetical protein